MVKVVPAVEGGSRMPDRAYSYLRFSSARQEKGSSRGRQTAFAERVCEEENLVLDESLAYEDAGISGRKGKTLIEAPGSRGLGAFLAAIRAGRVAPGSVLILENLDRLTRMPLRLATPLFLGIVNAGVDIITAEPRRRYTAAQLNGLADFIEPLLHMDRAWQESERKSQLIAASWRKRREKAWQGERSCRTRDGAISNQKAPWWIRAGESGWEVIEDRAATMRAAARLCREGLGTGAMIRELRALGHELPNGGKSGFPREWFARHWRLRLVLGEWQPQSVGEGGRVAAGAAVPNYYPAIMTEEELAETRAAVARRRNRSGRPAGRDGGPPNLFCGLVYDSRTRTKMGVERRRRRGKVWPALMPARGAEGGSALGVPYGPFEEAVLTAVSELGAEELAGPEGANREERIARLSAAVAEEAAKQEQLEGEIARATSGGVMAALCRALEGVVARKESAARERDELKLASRSSRAELLGEAQGLAAAYASLEGAEKAAAAGRLRAAIARVVDEIWVLVQPLPGPRGQRKIAHVRIYMQGGGTKYFALVVAKSAGARPWPIAGLDLRSGDATTREHIANLGRRAE